MPRKPAEPKLHTSIPDFGCIFQRTYRDKKTGEKKKTAVWYIEYKVRGDREPVRRSTGLTDQAAAYAELAKLHGKYHSGELDSATSQTVKFSGLFQLLTDDYKKQKRRTIGDMQARVEKWLVPAFGSKRVLDLRKRDVEAFIADAQKKLEPATINKLLAYMHRAMTLGMKEDPALVLRIPQWFTKFELDNERTGTLTDEQYQTLKAVLQPHAALALCIGYHTGMRRGLILGLKWEWVDLRAGVIRIPPENNATKKRPRNVPIYGDMGPMLEIARERSQSAYVIEYEGKNIFSLKTAWEKARQVCGCEGIHFHDLRRTATTNALLAGVSEVDIMQMCGWKTAAMIRRYAQGMEERAKATGRKMEAFLTASRGAAAPQKERTN